MGPGTLLATKCKKYWAEVVKRLFDAHRPSRELTIVIIGSASLLSKKD